MPKVLLKVAMKTLCLPSQADLPALEERVLMLWHVSTCSHHICRVYGVSSVNGQACLVMKRYPYSLASELASMPGQLQVAKSVRKQHKPITTLSALVGELP